jgi:hypothetical protein
MQAAHFIDPSYLSAIVTLASVTARQGKRRDDEVARFVNGNDGCRRRVDGTAGLPSAPGMPCAPRQVRLVPIPDLRRAL